MTVGEEPRPGRGDGGAMLLGHHTELIYLVMAGISIADDALGKAAESGPLSWLTVAFGVFFIFSLFANVTVHNHRLCERCVAATPLDPQAQAERWRPALRLNHARRLWMAAIAVILVKSVLWHFFPESPLLYATDALVVFAIACLVAASWVHRRLYPWCPFCHWGDGGSHEEVREPDPDPAAAK